MSAVNYSYMGAGKFQLFLCKKELQSYSDLINKDEVVEDITLGFHNVRNGIVILTDSRIIFFSKGLIFGSSILDSLNWNKVSSARLETNLSTGTIYLQTIGSNIYEVIIRKKSIAKAVFNRIQSKVNK